MFNSRSSLSVVFLVLFLFFSTISATPVPISKGHAPVKAPSKAPPKSSPKSAPKSSPKHCPSHLVRRNNNVFIGYNGFSGTARPPQASAGGELGAVFYIADAVDLAKVFAHGADSSKDTICLVYADANAWHNQPKVWVPANAPRGNAMNSRYPGAVLFDDHTSAGLPAGSVHSVHQMGIRQAQISRLGVTIQCYPKSCFATDHHTMNYPSLKHTWAIQDGR
ncbi:hypothetical protein BDN70DRAFT_794674 [Pholiota conissans]|uniref:Uncharacterized protein n=1 Tax=Pholiota conissans TaxID=109636 RepID=A0A9P6D071_9AGAR|nr:hypothetical protein BDN70DRAFT_794674 [Pholiota conissans]